MPQQKLRALARKRVLQKLMLCLPYSLTGWQMCGPCRHAQTLRVVSGGVSGAASTES